MTRIWTLSAAAGVIIAAAFALPAAAQNYSQDYDNTYYHNESCYDRDQEATGGGVVAGAVVGGAVGGPVGAVVGAAVGGSAGDDSVDCRYERYEDGNGYDRYGDGYGRGRDGGQGDYRDGYRDGYHDRDNYDRRLNGMDRGYHADGYYYRRSTYREGYYDRYGVWHSSYDTSRRNRY